MLTSEQLPTAFQGEPGAYSEAAVLEHFGPETLTLPCPNFDEVFAAVESGRYKEHAPGAGAGEAERLQRLFWEQCRGAGFEVLPGPGRICRWGAPAAARGAAGEPLHDDLLLSAALAAHLLGERWGSAESAVIRSYDPLQDMQF